MIVDTCKINVFQAHIGIKPPIQSYNLLLRAVLTQALRDGYKGHQDALAWLSDPKGGRMYCDALGVPQRKLDDWLDDPQPIPVLRIK